MYRVFVNIPEIYRQQVMDFLAERGYMNARFEEGGIGFDAPLPERLKKPTFQQYSVWRNEVVGEI